MERMEFNKLKEAFNALTLADDVSQAIDLWIPESEIAGVDVSFKLTPEQAVVLIKMSGIAKDYPEAQWLHPDVVVRAIRTIADNML